MDEEILKIANKNGFPTRFRKHRELLNEKIALLNFLKIQREKINRNKNSEEFNYFMKLADEIEKIIDNEEKRLMARDGKTLKQLEDWVEANPK